MKERRAPYWHTAVLVLLPWVLLFVVTSARADGTQWDLHSPGGSTFPGVTLGNDPCADPTLLVAWYAAIAGGSGSMNSCTGGTTNAIVFSFMWGGSATSDWTGDRLGAYTPPGDPAPVADDPVMNFSKTSHLLQAFFSLALVFLFFKGYQAGERVA